MVLAHMRNVLEGDRPRWLQETFTDGDHTEFLLSTALIRASTFSRIGVFTISFVSGSDADWLMRLADAGHKPAVMTDVLLPRHVHEENESRRSGAALAARAAEP